MYGLPGKDSVVIKKWEMMVNPVNFILKDTKFYLFCKQSR